MKYILVVSLIMCSFVLLSCEGGGSGNATNKPTNSAANSPTTTTSANAEADLKKLIGDFASALSKNDTAALDKFYSDDYTLVTATGDVATKAQRLDAMKSGDLKFENVTFTDLKVRSYGDTAVVIGNSSGKSTNKGKTTDSNYRVTFVVNKTKDGWRIVSAHLSPLPPEVPKMVEPAKKEESNKTAGANKPAEANKTANKPANK